MRTASAGYAQALIEHLRSLGRDPATVLGHVLDEVAPMPASARVDALLCRRMIQRTVHHLQDPAYPLRLAAHIETRHLGLLGFLLMSSSTLADAARLLQRYEPLLDDINTAHFELDEHHCQLTWMPLVKDPLPDHIMLSMGVWVHQARSLSGRPDLQCDVEFSFARPAEPQTLSVFHETFGGQVRFGCPLNRLIAPAWMAHLPVRQAQPEVHAELLKLAEQRLQGLALAPDTWQLTVEHVVRRLLDGRRPSLDQVAAQLGIAPRTLQTRLDQGGVHYRALVDRVMLDRACMLLRDRQRSLSDIALTLGFANQSSFQHAFKRWTGQSPGAWRQGLSRV